MAFLTDLSFTGVIMISVNEALDRVLDLARAMPRQSVGLRQATGRYLADSVVAKYASPPFDTSAMDGFAVRAADLAEANENSPVRMPLAGEILAGRPADAPLAPGKVVGINTGAPVPEGADAIVPVERTRSLGEGGARGEEVEILRAPSAGDHIRRAGEDFGVGEVLLGGGLKIDSRTTGLLASLGYGEVSVTRRPRVAVMSSGSELVEPGNPLGPGQIYNSNLFALTDLLTAFGAEVHPLGVVRDKPEETRAGLEAGFGYDVLVTTGGVSMGTRDLIRPTLLELGADEIFWKVRQRPGKPLFFAKMDATLCFGLPGNPVSVLTAAIIYLRPAILKMLGATSIDLPWENAIAGADFPKKKGLTFFARADRARNSPGDEKSEDGPVTVVPSTGQGSHQMKSFALAAGIVRLPEQAETVEAGAAVEFVDLASIC